MFPGFDVAMKDAALVRVVHGAHYLGDQFCRLPDRHRRLFNYFVKLAAFDKLHAEVARAVALAYFMDWNDTGMLQASRSFGFKAKALQVCFGRPLTKANNL
jgi:hypothetical protein